MIGIYVGASDSRAECYVEECINISYMLKNKNKDIIYILTNDMYADILQKEGYNFVVVDDTNEIISDIVKIIMEKGISSLIIDSAAVTSDEIANLSIYVKVIAFDEDKLPKNLMCVINSNPFVSWNDYILNYCNGDTRLFLGGDFAPVSVEFASVDSMIIEREAKVKDIVVYTGRYDRYGVGFSLISQMVRMPEFDGCRLHIIIGDGYNSFDTYYELEKETEGRVVVHTREENRAEIIASCDIAVSAGGLQLMELAACGIPSVIYATIEEQSEMVRQMIVKEYAVGVGDIWISIELKIENIIENVIRLMSDVSKRRELSANIKTLTDGKGTERIVNALI